MNNPGLQASVDVNPAKILATPEETAAHHFSRVSVSNAPINILIVDDETANLVVLETVLDDPRYRLVRALTPDQALMALVETEFALLILDIRLPGMTGFELAQIIKQRKKTASVPIIQRFQSIRYSVLIQAGTAFWRKSVQLSTISDGYWSGFACACLAGAIGRVSSAWIRLLARSHKRCEPVDPGWHRRVWVHRYSRASF